MVCTISDWIDINQREVFRQLLDSTLVTMAAHLSVYLRLVGEIEEIPGLDSFCHERSNMLFWNEQPRTHNHWEDSFLQWAFPLFNKNAPRIARGRHRQTPDFLKELAMNHFRLTSEVISQLGSQPGEIFELLRLKIDQDMSPGPSL
jgi:hypothetical protein